MALIAVASASLGLAACSDESDADTTPAPTEVAPATATAAPTEVAAAAVATEAVHGHQSDRGHEVSSGALLAAIRLVDTAGFHGMDDSLNGASPSIEARWVGAVNRAVAAAQAVTWPGDTEAAAATFLDDAKALVAALESDDAAAAAPLAAAAHESQHALSHAVFHELEHLAGADATPGAMLAALIYLDTAGFHGMDEALNTDTPAIEPRWAGATENALVAIRAVDWGALQPQADAFIEDATALLEALAADDASAAAEPAAAAHESQHALSHDAYHALGELSAADATVGAQLAAIILVDAAGFHGMDDALNGEAPEIVASWAGATRGALAAARLVDWGEQQAAADAFIEGAAALLAALEADDAAAAAEPAVVAHEAQHALSHDVYAALGVGSGHAH